MFLSELATGTESPARAEVTADAGATRPVVPSPSEKPGDSIDLYKLIEKVGEGGCGVVYVVEQTEPVRRLVALKVMILKATRRRTGSSCSAIYTTPMPPSPIFSSSL
jgi:hypothetical protein